MKRFLVTMLIIGGVIMATGCSSQTIPPNNSSSEKELSSGNIYSLEEVSFDDATTEETNDKSEETLEDTSVFSSVTEESEENHETSAPDEDFKLPQVYVELEKSFAPCKLIVNEKDITFGNYVAINKAEYEAAVPLVAVLKELGADVQDVDSTTKKVTCNGKVYTLDFEDCVLLNDEDINVLQFWGGTYFAYRRGEELIVTDTSINEVFWEMELNYAIRIDKTENAILIVKSSN